MEILAIIACAVGASFCFVFAGALATERPAPSNAHEMYNLIGITPDNVHEYMV